MTKREISKTTLKEIQKVVKVGDYAYLEFKVKDGEYSYYLDYVLLGKSKLKDIKDTAFKEGYKKRIEEEAMIFPTIITKGVEENRCQICGATIIGQHYC